MESTEMYLKKTGEGKGVMYPSQSERAPRKVSVFSEYF
jgi:hypothetical protein